MKDIRDTIEFYKAERISDQSLELELMRASSPFANLTVKADSTTLNGTTNSTYVGMLIPELVNGTALNTLVLDKNLIMNKLSVDDTCKVIEIGERLAPWAVKKLSDFVRAHNGTETSYLECIEIYFIIYLGFYDVLKDHASLRELIISKSVDAEKLQDLQLALQEKTEKHESIIEYILVNKLMPKLALEKAEQLYKEINTSYGPIDSEIGTEKPLQNYWYARAAALSTGIINPEYHKDLDPYYEPKR